MKLADKRLIGKDGILMSDLISRQKMLQTYYDLCVNTLCIECPFHFGDAVTGDCLFEKWIHSLPSAEPDIIACGDCKHYIIHDKRCGYWNHGVKPLMWCSEGERRTNE